MPHEIYQWDEIKERFTDALLVGNGGSIAVHPGFRYGGLFEQARLLGHLTPDVRAIFAAFDTEDFELVLRRLWQAKHVNHALGIEVARVDEAHVEVRDALVRTIQATHIAHENALHALYPIYRFMRAFKTVVSLNYDLLVYWATLLGNDELGSRYHFKDGFRHGLFAGDWAFYRRPYDGVESPTIFCYAHGNIALALNPELEERKINAEGGSALLDAIVASWRAGGGVPLFICEGRAEHKLGAIMKSPYLRSVYEEILGALGDSITVYGWQMASQDRHILERVAQNPPKRAAVSVYRHNQDYCTHAVDTLKRAGVAEVVFYDAASPGAWNNPRP